MIEREMGYRGSKSEFIYPQLNYNSVKEQRVDGSYFGLKPKLRYTLMGFERNYPVRIPSNQIIIQTFTVQSPRLNRSFYTHSNKQTFSSKY